MAALTSAAEITACTAGADTLAPPIEGAEICTLVEIAAAGADDTWAAEAALRFGPATATDAELTEAADTEAFDPPPMWGREPTVAEGGLEAEAEAAAVALTPLSPRNPPAVSGEIADGADTLGARTLLA